MVCKSKCCIDQFLRSLLIITQVGILCEWTNDSQRFLLEYFDTINDSPSHIYHSALPCSPSSSWLHKYYGTELSQEVKVIKGLPTRWGICSRTVLMNRFAMGLSCWDNTIAVGSGDRDIVLLDAITGSQTAVLSGHTDEVNSVVFSSDGRSLVSGSDDKTIKLWDVQTGGVVRTFSGHTDLVRSVSISVDCTTIASGSWDHTVCLWDTQKGECYCVIKQQCEVHHVIFSPIDSQHLLSVSGAEVSQWDINGHQAGPPFDGRYVAFAPDGIQVVSYHQTTAMVRNFSSGEIVAKFHVAPTRYYPLLCFSPNGKLVVASTETTVSVWDIASSEPHLIETFIAHSDAITSLIFPSPTSFISAAYDRTIKFWQIHTPSMGAVEADPESVALTSAIVMSITLHTEQSITITSDLDGVVRTWDISTGLCKAAFQTPAKGTYKRDVQLTNNGLVLVWCVDEKLNIWDVEQEKLLFEVDGPYNVEDLKISGDGSRVFLLDSKLLKTWSTQTGEFMGTTNITFVPHSSGSLTVDGSKVWVHNSKTEDEVWDFGTPDSPPVQLPNMPLTRLHPNGTLIWDSSLSGIKEEATGRVVFRLSQRYGRPVHVHWIGQYLVTCFVSGEVLTLDFGHILL